MFEQITPKCPYFIFQKVFFQSRSELFGPEGVWCSQIFVTKEEKTISFIKRKWSTCLLDNVGLQLPLFISVSKYSKFVFLPSGKFLTSPPVELLKTWDKFNHLLLSCFWDALCVGPSGLALVELVSVHCQSLSH